MIDGVPGCYRPTRIAHSMCIAVVEEMHMSAAQLISIHHFCIGLPIHCNYHVGHYSGFSRLSPSILNRFTPKLQA